MTQEAERFEDMSQRGRLRVIQQDDGDMIVYVIEDMNSINGGPSAGVEFCTSGGKSPKTREALRALMLAMAEDNADRPNCHRRGERGLGVDSAANAAQPPKYGAIAERAEQGLNVGWWARCTQCNYQHGHQIGCPNNPVDIALTAAQPKQSTPTAQDRLKPLSDEQIEDYRWNWLHGPAGVHPSAFVAGFRSAEIAHGIGTAK